MKNQLLILMLFMIMTGCSDNGSSSSNVFEDQVESIDKAEEVEQQILDAAERQRQQIEENLSP
ncbi:MAG: hypothetical protein HKN08_06410 [Gammaproteobacteria bacterium]|nr:hypothetical protein [Gammaproteobacteria bacterium]